MTDFVRHFLCFDDFLTNAALSIPCSISAPRQDYGQIPDFLLISICFEFMHKNQDDLQLIANHPGFSFYS